MRVTLLLIFACFLSAVASTACGPDMTSWYARQLDLARNQGDKGWSSGSYAWDAVLGTDSDSFISGLSAAAISSTTCPATAECDATATVCGICMTKKTASLIAHGYVSGSNSASSLFGALRSSVPTTTADTKAVMIGFYLRGKVDESKEVDASADVGVLEDDTTYMCKIVNGVWGNILRGMLYSGMQGDMTAQDTVLAAEEATSEWIPAWESSTGLTLSTIVSEVLSDFGPTSSSVGSWLGLVSHDVCTPCAETWSGDDLALKPVVSPAEAAQKLRIASRNIAARTVTSTVTAKCNSKFARQSADWSLCSKWTMVVETAKLASIGTSGPVGGSLLAPRISTECAQAEIAMLTEIKAMDELENPCDEDALITFTTLLDNVMELCSSPSFLPIIKPFVGCGNVMCHAQHLYTGGTGQECFSDIIDRMQNLEDLYLDYLPICTQCSAEIFTKEKFDLGFNLFCTSPSVPKPGQQTCLGVFNWTLGFPEYAIPSECLVPVTTTQKPADMTVPSYCADAVAVLAEHLDCCCYIFNDILRMMGYAIGGDGLVCPPCTETTWKYNFNLKGLDYDTAVSDMGEDAVTSMLVDEIAHRVPVPLRSEYIRNIQIQNVVSGKRDTPQLEASFEYQQMNPNAMIDYDVLIQDDDTLVEMTDFVTEDSLTSDSIVITDVSVTSANSGSPSTSSGSLHRLCAGLVFALAAALVL